MKLSPLVEVFSRSECDMHFEELEEKSTGVKQLWLETTVQRADTRNRNGRIYPRAVLEREVHRFQQHIDEGTSYGEADHPAPGKTPSATRQAILWKSVVMQEDGAVRGRGIIMDTHVGKDIKAILAAGGAIGTSSRGRGTVSLKSHGQKGEQAEVVNEDFRMRTFDLVIDQSVEDAQSRLTRHEHVLMEQEDLLFHEEESVMNTLAELKENHPEIYTALLREAAESGEKGLQERLQALLVEKEAEIRAEIGEAELDEDTQSHYANLEALATVVVEAVKQAGLLEDVALSDDAIQERIVALKTENADLKKRVARLEAANAGLVGKVEKVDVGEAATEFAADHAFSTELAESLVESCPDMAVFEAKKAQIRKRFDSLASKIIATPPKSKGSSLTEIDNPKPGAKPVVERTEIDQKREDKKRRLAESAGVGA